MNTQQMEHKLKEAYPQAQVAVIDLTGTSDHFEVRMSEPSFDKLTRIQQHKKVMEVFSEELASGEVHALAIKIIKL